MSRLYRSEEEFYKQAKVGEARIKWKWILFHLFSYLPVYLKKHTTVTDQKYYDVEKIINQKYGS